MDTIHRRIFNSKLCIKLVTLLISVLVLYRGMYNLLHYDIATY